MAAATGGHGAVDCEAVVAGFARIAEPSLRAAGALACWVFGSYARGTADAYSDLDVIVVAPTERSFFDRHRDYLDVILAAPAPVQMLVYTPEELARMRAEERPFIMHALEGARLVYGTPPDEGSARRG